VLSAVEFGSLTRSGVATIYVASPTNVSCGMAEFDIVAPYLA